MTGVDRRYVTGVGGGCVMKIEEGCEETDYVKAAGWSPLFVPGCADFRRQGDGTNTPHVSSAVRCQVRSATDL